MPGPLTNHANAASPLPRGPRRAASLASNGVHSRLLQKLVQNLYVCCTKGWGGVQLFREPSSLRQRRFAFLCVLCGQRRSCSFPKNRQNRLVRRFSADGSSGRIRTISDFVRTSTASYQVLTTTSSPIVRIALFRKKPEISGIPCQSNPHENCA